MREELKVITDTAPPSRDLLLGVWVKFMDLKCKQPSYQRAPLGAQMVKNLPSVQETWVQSLGWEDPLEEKNGYWLQYSCLESPMDTGT